MTKRNLLYAMEWLYKHSSCCDICFALLGLLVISCIRERLSNRKGPMMWPILGSLPTLFFHIKDVYGYVTKALVKSGGTFRYRGVWMGGAYGVMTANPSNVEYMLRTNFRNFPKGKYYRERFQELLGDGIFNADDEIWKEQRMTAKIELHSSRFVEHSFKMMQEIVKTKLFKLTEKMANSGQSFELQDVLLRFTFDNICTAAFGVDPGCLSPDLPEVSFAKAFEEATELTLFRFLVPPPVWKTMRFLRLGSERRLNQATKTVHNFADETVKERRNRLAKLGSLKDYSDLLSRLIEMKQDAPDAYFRDFCVSFILAGRDTTSVALTWFFWLMHNHQHVENKILHEITSIISNRELINGTKNTEFTMEELKKMDYLHAALTESLRLYPSVPIEMKEVVESDVLPDGSIVTKGARVFFSLFSMGRLESLWGEDCLDYKPERWMNKDAKFVSENTFKYVVFNGGPRLCLGKNFAYMQMKMVAASILSRYEVKVVEGHEVAPKLTTTLYMKNGLLVTLKPRTVTCK